MEAEKPGFKCPKCERWIVATGVGLPSHPNCPDCGALLWCRVRVDSESILLQVVPGTKPEISDMAAVAHSLPISHHVRGLVVNLCGSETVNSSFLAGLLVLNRLVKAVGGRLVLCELHPHVLSVLQRLNLHTLMTIRDSA